MGTRPLKVSLDIDAGIYSIDAVYGASYIFLDRCYISLAKPATGRISVTLKAKPGISISPEALEGEFENELLNQSLRAQVYARNARLREYVIGRALYGAEPRHEGEGPSYSDDPLGIAVPWEEKYGS